MLHQAMAKDRSPTVALALGMLAELRAAGAGPAAAAAMPGAGTPAAAPSVLGATATATAADFSAATVVAQDAAIVAAAQRHADSRLAVRQCERALATAGRAMAQANGDKAAAALQRGRLQARMDELRRAQAQASTDELARKLRRQRAELAVEAQAVGDQLAGFEANYAAARAELGRLQAQLDQLEAQARQHNEALTLLQRQAPPLAQQLTAIERDLAWAHVHLFLQLADDKERTSRRPSAAGAPALAAAAVADWRQQIRRANAALVALHAALRQGRYPQDDTDGVLGGRALATGEGICAAIAAGAPAEALALFAAACPPEQFFHQMLPVFRAYCFGLYLSGEHARLAAGLRLHRYDGGLHGALAEAFWWLVQKDADAFDRALTQLVLHDWRTWSHTRLPAMGFVSTTTCALARLANSVWPARTSPELGLTVPSALFAG